MKVATLRVLARRLALLVAVPASMNAEAATPTTAEPARQHTARVNAGRWPPNRVACDRLPSRASIAATLDRGTGDESRFSAGASASIDLLPALFAAKPQDDASSKKSKPDNRFQVICTFNGDRAVCRYASTVKQRMAVNGRITALMSPQRAINQRASENMKDFTFAALDAWQVN
ncbi:hypothetical protein [Burkholderia sp. BCC1644]|uniref:hypothetical protein n=1 Tax=Burkholderia sp. BCC1644 TaxID=2676293 RepID=UPI0015903FF2|nr:hypothetical protein [Burkholderia sp. BCC1644]